MGEEDVDVEALLASINANFENSKDESSETLNQQSETSMNNSGVPQVDAITIIRSQAEE